jgi:hypothetical protein
MALAAFDLTSGFHEWCMKSRKKDGLLPLTWHDALIFFDSSRLLLCT